MAERPHFRHEGRRPLAVRVRFRRNGRGSNLEREGTTLDLSLGGAFVETDWPPPVGTSVVLWFSAATAWEPVELIGEVRWVSDGKNGKTRGFGVRFGPLEGATATALYELAHTHDYSEPTP